VHATDVSVFRIINGWPGGVAPFFDFLSEANKNWVVRILVLLLIGYLLYKGLTTRVAAILSLVSIGLANLVCDLLKNHAPMARPCVELTGVVNHGVGFLTSNGTASAHAANMAALAAVMSFFFGRWGLLPLALALLVGLSRIYVGVHYPSQVVFGWFVGAVIGSVCVSCYRLWEGHYRPKESELEPPSRWKAVE
jgi:undecaprenyl-diphosphatase